MSDSSDSIIDIEALTKSDLTQSYNHCNFAKMCWWDIIAIYI